MQPVNVYQNNLRAFQQQIDKIPPLSHKQVCWYAKQVQSVEQLQKLRRDLCQQLDGDPTFAEWAAWAKLSETDLANAMGAGRWAKARLIEAHLYLVIQIARCYQNRGVELLDLIQEGSVGLGRGVEKFDPARGCKLSTYARWWIRREMGRAIRLKEQEKSSVIQGESTAILEQIKSTAPLPDETVAQSQQLESLKHLLEHQLPKRQREVLLLLYGLIDGKPRSLKQAANELEITLERVRWLRDAGLKRLRRELFNPCLPIR